MPELSAAELFEERIKQLVKHAPALRRAGVLDIEIDGFKATLAPDRGDLPADTAKAEKDASADPLKNPNTFGLPDGAPLPRLTHLEISEDVKPGSKQQR